MLSQPVTCCLIVDEVLWLKSVEAPAADYAQPLITPYVS